MAGTIIIGAFDDARRVDSALADLQAAGFTSAQVRKSAEGEEARSALTSRSSASAVVDDHAAPNSTLGGRPTSFELSDDDARYFEESLAQKYTLVTVRADGRASEAVTILQRHGAYLGLAGLSAHLTPAETSASSAQWLQPDENAGDQTLQLRAERLAIDKIRVANGEARIRKEVITERQSINVPVSHEELVIERRSVADVASVGGPIGTDQTIIVPLCRENISVRQQTFITEEVEIGKHTVADTVHVAETVRHEQLVVEPVGVTEPPSAPR